MLSNRLRPIVAWRALRRLIADPEQTHEVFAVIRALSGSALENGYKRFRQTDVGRQVLQERIDLLDTLRDHETLAILPRRSLGAHYLSFIRRENISAEGLVEASEEEEEFKLLDENITRFAVRQRDMHDLWHTLTDYGRDELGEACLLAFTYAQTKNRGVGVICLAGCLKLREFYGPGIFPAAWAAYKAGKRAVWLPAENWETRLAQPIDDVRRALNIEPPEAYLQLREAVLSA
ncbi:MAG: Coq4 family protein [Pseudomonadota bacterium]|nr:Coq4 family protein [Pseudomonadota bacterium]